MKPRKGQTLLSPKERAKRRKPRQLLVPKPAPLPKPTKEAVRRLRRMLRVMRTCKQMLVRIEGEDTFIKMQREGRVSDLVSGIKMTKLQIKVLKGTRPDLFAGENGHAPEESEE